MGDAVGRSGVFAATAVYRPRAHAQRQPHRAAEANVAQQHAEQRDAARAAVARAAGLDVTVVEMADRVMSRTVSPETSDFYQIEHTNHGVKLRLATGVKSINASQPWVGFSEPSSTSSSPVDSTATRGRRCTVTVAALTTAPVSRSACVIVYVAVHVSTAPGASVTGAAAGPEVAIMGEDGTLLPRSIVEYYLKSDELGDPMVSEEHITAFGWANTQDLDEMLGIFKQAVEV